MTTTLAIVGGGFLLVALVIYLAYVAGKSKGGSDQRTNDAQVTADSRDRQQQAVAEGPRNLDDALNKLGEGKF